MGYDGYHVKKNNWGDDINLFFFESITDKKLIFIPFEQTLLKVKRYSLIGSIIGYGNLNNLIICGSGIKNPKVRLIGKPRKVLSVRGPRSREILLANNIDCPANYGDPALLLPVFYHPSVSKKFKYGFVPNEATNEADVLTCIKNMGIAEGEYLIIHMTEYHEWTDIIDDILSCDNIVSESLHGIIVAETYKIPSCWVEFTRHADYWPFKYLDFYESIGKVGCDSVKLYRDDCENGEVVIKSLLNWEEVSIDYQKLLSFFPFEVSEKVLGSGVLG
jgi:pyruvyltransferase